MKKSLIVKHGIDANRLLTRGFGGSVPLEGPPGTDSKRVEIRVVGALSETSAVVTQKADQKRALRSSLKSQAAIIASKKAADAQDRFAEAERRRVAAEEKERMKREKMRKERENFRRIEQKRDETRRDVEVEKLKASNRAEAQRIEKDYLQEKKSRQAATEAKISAISQRERKAEEGRAVREKLEWERQIAAEVRAIARAMARAPPVNGLAYISPSQDDEKHAAPVLDPASEEVRQRKREIQQEIIHILFSDHIIFKPNTTIIVQESEPTVEKLAALLSENQDITVRIEGHVAVPERKRNRPKKMRQAEQLSAERAKSVLADLVSRGISADRLQAKGFGGTRPLPDGQNSKRVEIKVDGLPENEKDAVETLSDATLMAAAKQIQIKEKTHAQASERQRVQKEMLRLQIEATVADELAAEVIFARLLMAGNPTGGSKEDQMRLKRLEEEAALNQEHVLMKSREVAARFQNLKQTSTAKQMLKKTRSFSNKPTNTLSLRKIMSFAPNARRGRPSKMHSNAVTTWNVVVQTKLDDSLKRTLLQVNPNEDTPDTLLESLKFDTNAFVCEVLQPGSGKPRNPRVFLLQSSRPLKEQLGGDGSWVRVRRRTIRKAIVPAMHRFASFVK